MNEPTTDHISDRVDDDDVLAESSRALEGAEGEDDDARLAVLDAVHARLSTELDKPADESSAP